MRELIGEDYEKMTAGERNSIFTTLIEPDLETAVEYHKIKKISHNIFEKLKN